MQQSSMIMVMVMCFSLQCIHCATFQPQGINHPTKQGVFDSSITTLNKQPVFETTGGLWEMVAMTDDAFFAIQSRSPPNQYDNNVRYSLPDSAILGFSTQTRKILFNTTLDDSCFTGGPFVGPSANSSIIVTCDNILFALDPVTGVIRNQTDMKVS
eukprot:TRINITY_DN23717_c0_g1_i1.p1 TRINITY_DN23717_c0_g1~~TRINITY_DN23717_c0_g1_i1.p1  ORF type:complete len:156 (+),score=38.48 TRINITY_DN23717_c0_g1_i1:241-708(+)